MNKGFEHEVTGDDWGGILHPGERILWQGRPDGRIVFTRGTFALVGFGLAFSGFAAVWMSLASMAGGFFWAFGIPHFLVGLGVIWSGLFFPAWRRRHSWYTLTDRRAFIATDLPLKGRKLTSWPIRPGTPLEMDDRNPGTVYFQSYRVTSKNGTRNVKVGFERIAEADMVYRLIRDVTARPDAETPPEEEQPA